MYHKELECLINEYKKNNNTKNKILNESISLDSEDEDNNSLLDLITDNAILTALKNT